MKPQRPPSIETAVVRLRTLALAAKEGVLLGAEEELQSKLGVARSTMRQVARILETEGLVRVKRGANGGYFASRPAIDLIERAASAYLKTESIELKDVITVGSLLWPEVVRQAANLYSEDFNIELAILDELLERADEQMSAAEFLLMEHDITERILNLSGSKYIGLIFGINRMFLALVDGKDFLVTPPFITAWKSKLAFQLTAIRSRDKDMATYAARSFREFFQHWVENEMLSIRK